jgi:hypothetical protein
MVQVVARVVREAGAKERELRSTGIHVLVAIGTLAAQQALIELATQLPEKSDRERVVSSLQTAALGEGNEAAADLFEQFLAGQQGSPDLAAYARAAFAKALPHCADRLDALAARPDGILKAKAAAEIARLKALDPAVPYLDLSRLERWKKDRLYDLDQRIEQDRRAVQGKRRPDPGLTERLRATTALRGRVAGMRLLDLGVEALGEYYDATAQNAAAVRAVVANKDLAEALSDLPTIAVERTEGFVDRKGELHVDGVTNSSIDLGRLAFGFFSMASAQSAVDAVRAREIAQRNAGMLRSLSEPTRETIRRRYVERISKDARVQAARSKRGSGE